jgi:hypothetical protein
LRFAAISFSGGGKISFRKCALHIRKGRAERGMPFARQSASQVSSRKQIGSDAMAKKSAQKRELIDTGTDKRYVRRDSEGKFKEVDDQGRSLSQDRRKKAKKKVKSGQGDKGDHR